MKSVIKAVGEQPSKIIENEPQMEMKEFVKAPGPFTENIEISGNVPKDGHFFIKVVVMIRDATEGEILKHFPVVPEGSDVEKEG